jgi:hypothetical protein
MLDALGKEVTLLVKINMFYAWNTVLLFYEKECMKVVFCVLYCSHSYGEVKKQVIGQL